MLTLQDEDAVVLFNFRADRMVEISKAFEYPDFSIFDRVRYPKNLKVWGRVQPGNNLGVRSSSHLVACGS